uniref:Uncharacterized protein n=1 Tax=Arundo donax TaxID=35708 RepID=A0A0A9AUE1_ARUDO
MVLPLEEKSNQNATSDLWLVLGIHIIVYETNV